MTILWDLTLDGTSIGDMIEGFTVNYSRSSVHNTIDIKSINRDLFFLANPESNKGMSRITLYIGDRELHFLLEDRTGGEIDFSLWGRSISARDEDTYRVNIDYSLTTPRLASVVVSEMITTSSVSWNIMDWLLPKDFTFSGNPLSGAQQIVRAVGGILRCLDDGTIDVRYKWNIRPCNIATEAPVAEYDRIDTLITLSASDEFGSGENTVTITGYTPDLPNPLMEVEEDNPVVGEDVHVRVFWGNAAIPEITDQYVTDGYIQDLGGFSDTYTETVSFIEGVGRLQRPIHSLTSISWIGTSAAPVDYVSGESELFSDELWGIAEIEYTSEYRRYRLYGHDESKLIMVLTLEGAPDISVTVRLNVGDEDIANPISDNLLTTADAARQRGISYLDDTYYDMQTVTVEAPYHEDVMDGTVILVSAPDADVVGRYYVTSVGLVVDGPAVLNRIEMTRPIP